MHVRWHIALGLLVLSGGCRTLPETTSTPSASLSPADHATIKALAHYGRGLLFEGEQGPASAQARTHYEAALELAPTNHHVSSRVAAVALHQRDTDTAIAVLEASCLAAPDEIRRHIDLARVYRLSGDGAAAVEQYREALAIDPTATPLYLITAALLFEGSLDAEARDALAEAHAHAPRREMVEVFLYQQARRFVGAKAMARAIPCVELMLTWQPERGAELHHLLAEIHQTLDQKSRARHHLQRAIAQQGTQPVSYIELAATYPEDALDEQIEVLDLAMQRYPDNPFITYVLASVLAEHGRHTEAIDYFERTESLTNVSSSDGEQIPLDEIFYLQYGASLERLGRTEEAARVFRECLEHYPSAHQVLNYLAYMWAEQKEHLDEALDLIEEALAIAPDNGAYLDTRGWIYHKQGRHEDALKDLLAAARVIPDDPEILEHIGDVYRALGDMRNAAAYWRDCLRADPARPGVTEKLKALEHAHPHGEQTTDTN